MGKKEHKCSECPNRKKYDKNPKSFIERLWVWHIKFCPDWKAYMSSLDEQERLKIKQRYNLEK